MQHLAQVSRAPLKEVAFVLKVDFGAKRGEDTTAPHPQALQPLRCKASTAAAGGAGSQAGEGPPRAPRGDRAPPGPRAAEGQGGRGDPLGGYVSPTPLQGEARPRHRASRLRRGCQRASQAAHVWRPPCHPPSRRVFLLRGGGRGRTPRPQNKGWHRPPAAFPGWGLRAEKRPWAAANRNESPCLRLKAPGPQAGAAAPPPSWWAAPAPPAAWCGDGWCRGPGRAGPPEGDGETGAARWVLALTPAQFKSVYVFSSLRITLRYHGAKRTAGKKEVRTGGLLFICPCFNLRLR